MNPKNLSLAKALRLDLIILYALFSGILLTGCERYYSETPQPTPIYAFVFDAAQRGSEYPIIIPAGANALCYASVLYWNTDKKWIEDRLPDIQANEEGNCQWNWIVPDNAKEGIAGIRGYIEVNGESHNIFPSEFCIVKCSE